jgi:hypothetical protein
MINAKMLWRNKTLMPALLLTLLAAPAQAVEVRGLMKLGFDFGGDTVVTALFDTGDTSKIKLNEGMFLGGGVSLLTAGNSMSIDLTAAWKFTSINAINQDYDLTRFPLEALAFYNFSGDHGVRLGGGISYQLNPKFKASGDFHNFTLNYDNALGYVVQLDYLSKTRPKASGGFNWGLRYTAVDYEVNGFPAGAGNGLGFFVGGVF